MGSQHLPHDPVERMVETGRVHRQHPAQARKIIGAVRVSLLMPVEKAIQHGREFRPEDAFGFHAVVIGIGLFAASAKVNDAMTGQNLLMFGHAEWGHPGDAAGFFWSGIQPQAQEFGDAATGEHREKTQPAEHFGSHCGEKLLGDGVDDAGVVRHPFAGMAPGRMEARLVLAQIIE